MFRILSGMRVPCDVDVEFSRQCMEASFDFAFFAISVSRLSSGGLPGLSFPDSAASHDILDLADASVFVTNPIPRSVAAQSPHFVVPSRQHSMMSMLSVLVSTV